MNRKIVPTIVLLVLALLSSQAANADANQVLNGKIYQGSSEEFAQKLAGPECEFPYIELSVERLETFLRDRCELPPRQGVDGSDRVATTVIRRSVFR